MCNDIIADYFEDQDDIIKCKIRNCKNKVSINNFKPHFSVKTKKPRPICNWCFN